MFGIIKKTFLVLLANIRIQDVLPIEDVCP